MNADVAELLSAVTIEICPECNNANIDVEPAYKGNECVGSQYICRDCGWNQISETDCPEDAQDFLKQVEKEVVTVNALTGWLEGFREAAVEELRETSDLDKADQRHLQSEIETLDRLLKFFGDKNEKTGDTQ